MHLLTMSCSMTLDALISAQNAQKCVWRPGSAQTRLRSAVSSPRPPSWIQGVLLLRGERRRAPNFVSIFGGIEAPDCHCNYYFQGP